MDAPWYHSVNKALAGRFRKTPWGLAVDVLRDGRVKEIRVLADGRGVVPKVGDVDREEGSGSNGNVPRVGFVDTLEEGCDGEFPAPDSGSGSDGDALVL